MGGTLRIRPPRAYRTSTAASPPNRVITVLIMFFFRAVESNGFGTRLTRFAFWRNDQFEMMGMFCQFRRQAHAGLNEPAVPWFDRDFAEIPQVKRASRYAACADLIGLVLCCLVGDADLISIAVFPVRHLDVLGLPNLGDLTVVAAAGADAVGEIRAHQNQGRAISDGFQALPFHSWRSRFGCGKSGM